MSDYTKFRVNYELVDQYLAFCSSFAPYDMRSRSYPVAGFIVPFKCYELKKQEKCKYMCTNVLLISTWYGLDWDVEFFITLVAEVHQWWQFRKQLMAIILLVFLTFIWYLATYCTTVFFFLKIL
jgi:hypothetical protein